MKQIANFGASMWLADAQLLLTTFDWSNIEGLFDKNVSFLSYINISYTTFIMGFTK